MEKMSESRMHEIIEQANTKVYETDGLAVNLWNDAVIGSSWKEGHVETVGQIHRKLQLIQRILSGDTSAEDFGSKSKGVEAPQPR
jgi:hypothetical protein